jgi:hypothetical protein
LVGLGNAARRALPDGRAKRQTVSHGCCCWPACYQQPCQQLASPVSPSWEDGQAGLLLLLLLLRFRQCRVDAADEVSAGTTPTHGRRRGGAGPNARARSAEALSAAFSAVVALFSMGSEPAAGVAHDRATELRRPPPSAAAALDQDDNPRCHSIVSARLLIVEAAALARKILGRDVARVGRHTGLLCREDDGYERTGVERATDAFAGDPQAEVVLPSRVRSAADDSLGEGSRVATTYRAVEESPGNVGPE